jgi:hypothetical protein
MLLAERREKASKKYVQHEAHLVGMA